MGKIEHHYSKDGSSTFFSNEFQQFYHNPNGAIAESRHVFFEQSRFIERLSSSPEEINIFETGFGTGLNYLLLTDYVKKQQYQGTIHCYSIEAYPAALKIINQLNYGELLGLEGANTHLLEIFSKLKEGWNHFTSPLYPKVKLHLFFGLFKEFTVPDKPIDFFFHDPFSPEVNPELWSVKTFEKLKSFAADNSILTTYCSASKARAAMAKASWKVARAQGALGKREMTVASQSETKLSHLKRVNELRLIERLNKGEFADLSD